MDAQQQPFQITPQTFQRWVDAMIQAGIAVDVEPPTSESLHTLIAQPKGDL